MNSKGASPVVSLDPVANQMVGQLVCLLDAVARIVFDDEAQVAALLERLAGAPGKADCIGPDGLGGLYGP